MRSVQQTETEYDVNSGGKRFYEYVSFKLGVKRVME